MDGKFFGLLSWLLRCEQKVISVIVSAENIDVAGTSRFANAESLEEDG